jgi:hypothetical protein
VSKSRKLVGWGARAITPVVLVLACGSRDSKPAHSFGPDASVGSGGGAGRGGAGAAGNSSSGGAGAGGPSGTGGASGGVDAGACDAPLTSASIDCAGCPLSTAEHSSVVISADAAGRVDLFYERGPNGAKRTLGVGPEPTPRGERTTGCFRLLPGAPKARFRAAVAEQPDLVDCEFNRINQQMECVQLHRLTLRTYDAETGTWSSPVSLPESAIPDTVTAVATGDGAFVTVYTNPRNALAWVSVRGNAVAESGTMSAPPPDDTREHRVLALDVTPSGDILLVAQAERSTTSGLSSPEGSSLVLLARRSAAMAGFSDLQTLDTLAWSTRSDGSGQGERFTIVGPVLSISPSGSALVTWGVGRSAVYLTGGVTARAYFPARIDAARIDPDGRAWPVVTAAEGSWFLRGVAVDAADAPTLWLFRNHTAHRYLNAGSNVNDPNPVATSSLALDQGTWSGPVELGELRGNSVSTLGVDSPAPGVVLAAWKSLTLPDAQVGRFTADGRTLSPPAALRTPAEVVDLLVVAHDACRATVVWNPHAPLGLSRVGLDAAQFEGRSIPQALDATDDGCIIFDTLDDAKHCGAGLLDCSASSRGCVQGSCACMDLSTPLFCALADDTGGSASRCVAHSYSNCGACGKSCEGDQRCNQGSCACAAGKELCDIGGDCGNEDGVPTRCPWCVDLRIDPAHCGACNKTCPRTGTGYVACNAGQCGRCPSTEPTVCDDPSFTPFKPAGPRCVNLQTDQLHCGACGTACPRTTGNARTACTNGACARCPSPNSAVCVDPVLGPHCCTPPRDP